MSKRGMDSQGGDERYGSMDGQEQGMGGDEKPRAATAAQMARRKILAAKGTRVGSQRSSRAGSPAMGGPPQANPFAQAFQPPTANGFNFQLPGSTASPSFGDAPPNGNSFGSPAENDTPTFGGFGSTQSKNTPTFGSGFGSNNSQPQQTAFNSSSALSFGPDQNNDSTTPNSSFTFGQTQSQSSAQRNGFTPSTAATSVFGGSSFGGQHSQAQQQENGGSVFKFGLSQKEQETPKPATSSSGGFGQSNQQNGDKPAGTGLFTSTPAAATSKSSESVFGNLQNKSNGIKPGMFTQTQQNGEQTSKPTASFTFGPKPQANGEQTPKPATSFGGFKFGQTNEQSGERTPKPTTTFGGFGRRAETDSDDTPKPENPFGGFQFGQQNKDQGGESAAAQEHSSKPSDLFGGIEKKDHAKPSSPFKFGQAHAPQTPMPSNPFAGFGEQAQPSKTPLFKLGATQQEDTSMISPDSTPQKQAPTQNQSGLQISATTTEQPPATTQATVPDQPTNPNAGATFFERTTRDPPASAPKLSEASSNLFSTPTSTAHAGLGGNIFRAAETAPKPTSQLFASTTTSTLAPPVFKPSTTFGQPQEPQSQQPSLSRVASSSVPMTTASSAAPDRAKLRELNDGLMAHLKNEDPGNDWSVIFDYYTKEAAKLMGREAFKAPSAPSQPTPAPTPTLGSQSQPVHTMAQAPPGHSKPFSNADTISTPNSFNLNTLSKHHDSTNMFSATPKPPQTAPVSKKRAADEELTKTSTQPTAPATEKRTKPNAGFQYPQLPDTASDTAKLFASTLDKPAENAATPWNAPMSRDPRTRVEDGRAGARQETPPSFGIPGDVVAKVREQEAAKKFSAQSSTFTPSTASTFATSKPASSSSEKPAEVSQASMFGFKPSTTTSSTALSSVTTFNPPSGSSAGGFLAAFGKKAEVNAETEKKKRKQADYDSDEEDEAAWEARDRQKQEEMRKQFEESSKKGPSFVPKPSESEPQSKNILDPLHTRNTPEQHETMNTASAASNAFSAKPAATPFSGFNIEQSKSAETEKDSKANKRQAEKDQGTANHTWNPNTPIKFGMSTAGNETTTPGTAPPVNPFSGLFGSSVTPATNESGNEPGKLAPPSVGFVFGPSGGSLGTSRATTPGVTTDGEGSTAGEGENEPSEQQVDEQIEDMTALLPEEREAEEVLLELPFAKAMKFDERKTEDGTEMAWVERGRGPLYLLMNKTTGKTRILLKIPPLGKEAMNFHPKAGYEYQLVDGKMRMVRGTFFDHLGPKARANQPSMWSVQVREPKDAREIARILMEGRG